jgi:predicted cupin superfamily sugar epimerase
MCALTDFIHPRAAALIDRLELQPHPEGGYFREVFCSPHLVQPSDSRTERAALTTIYFLLVAGQHSRWHQVRSDEVWHYYEGDPLELLWIDREKHHAHRYLLGPVGATCRPVHVVPSGCWQAARSTGAYTLVGCSVGPGFDFADFRLISECPNEEAEICRCFPTLAVFV